MSRPVIRVVGLGPGDADLMSLRTRELLDTAPVVRLRTRRHPAVASSDLASYDEWYERAESFEDLYAAIVDDLVALAHQAPGEVVYAVPGSPVVAERTVELLRERDVEVLTEPAVSVIDVACAALGVDPMALGVRIVDALDSSEPLRGPGPLLVLQTYSPEVMALLASRLPASTPVTVLHHLGLVDQSIRPMAARDLPGFAADHLTSVWVEGLRDAGEAMNDLVDVTRRLRAECPWDQEQTHASLTRHLLEEAYEAIDALEELVRADAEGELGDEVIAHLEEELGDVLIQILHHAELGDEEGYFTLATIADTVRDKMISRHPHVFGDVEVADADEVASRWEVLKRDEKGRQSITEGIAWQLPALTLYTKLLRKATLVDLGEPSGESARRRALDALGALTFASREAGDAASSTDVAVEWGDAVEALARAAQWAGVDLEGVLRDRARRLREAIRAAEGV